MFFFVYVSSATRPFFREDLRVLLETWRKNNAELGVKGMLLLYKDGNFTQVLKGTRVPYAGSTRGSPPTPATAARSPCSRASPKGARSQTGPWVCATWIRPRRADPGYSEFLTGREFSGDPSLAQKLLITFKRTM